MINHTLKFKGIKFFDYPFSKLSKILENGGVLVAPAASALTQITVDKDYYKSLKQADIAIFDSGLFCILIRLFYGKKIKKLSGYLFLKKFIDQYKIKNKKILLIDPTLTDSKVNIKLMKRKKFRFIKSYVAPFYKYKIFDLKLLNEIKRFEPNYIIINIGGGVQEKLGIFIKKNIKRSIPIICTGAAISFLTKRQAPINDIVDKYYLGWFWRIIFNPKKFFFRTMKSLKLIKLFIN